MTPTHNQPTQPTSGSIQGKRVLVTGATGFIGSNLAKRLHRQGANVIALERTPGKGARLADLGIELARGDLSDSIRMAEIVGSGVQIVMHLGAWLRGSSRREAQAINVAATRQLAETSAKAGVERFVFTSSIAVYGPHGDQDVDEQTALRPYGDAYGDSKIQAEEALREVAARTGLPYVVVRPGMVYGPESRGWTVRMARWAQAGRLPLIDGGRGTAYPIYIDNLVDLLVLSTTHPAAVGETFNAVDDGPVTLSEFLGGYMKMVPTDRAIRLPCWAVRLLTVPASPFSRELNLRYIANQLCGRGRVLNQHAEDVLGWRPEVSLVEGLQRSEIWLREQGILA